MITRAEALEAAGEAIAAGLDLRDSLPPRQAAAICWTPTGPSLDELERRIRAQRGEQAAQVVPLTVSDDPGTPSETPGVAA
jgi:hypothetical protein